MLFADLLSCGARGEVSQTPGALCALGQAAFKRWIWFLQVEAFGAAVESLSRSWSSQNPELGYETALLSVSVKLGMYIAQKIPSVREQLVELINRNQVRDYIQHQGGWVSAESPRAAGSAPSLGSSGHSLRGVDSNSTIHWRSQRGAEPWPLVPCSSAARCSGCASCIGHCPGEVQCIPCGPCSISSSALLTPPMQSHWRPCSEAVRSVSLPWELLLLLSWIRPQGIN